MVPARQTRNVLFDSGPMVSAQQSYVHAPGLRLAADHTYSWTVRTQDASGQFGPYAPDAHFDTGLADADWNASWIRRAGTVPQVVQVDGTDIAADDFALIRKTSAVDPSPVVRGPRVRGGRSAVRALRQRHAGGRRALVLLPR